MPLAKVNPRLLDISEKEYQSLVQSRLNISFPEMFIEEGVRNQDGKFIVFTYGSTLVLLLIGGLYSITPPIFSFEDGYLV